MSNQDEMCVHNTFFSERLNDDQFCTFAQNDCHINYQFVNFYAFTYCDLNGYWGVFIPFAIIFVAIIFKFIGGVVEEYLAPAIAYATEFLNLSEAMGAVTLLALANGAGDVVTAIVASTTVDGINYNIGSLYGAGLFVTTLVVGMTILQAGADGVQLEPASIWRDVGFYIVSTILIIIFGAVGNLGIAAAIVLLGLYGLLVTVVFVQERWFPSTKKDNDEGSSLAFVPPTQYSALDEHNIRPDSDTTEDSHKKTQNRFKKAVHKVQVQNIVKKVQNLALWKLEQVRQRKKNEEDQTFEQMSLCEKISFIIDQPFVYIMKCTMPPAEPEHYSKIWATISITPGLIAMSLILGKSFGWYQLYALFPIGVACSAAIWFTSPDNEIPKYYIVLEVFAVFGALIWTYLVSGILIDLLNFVGNTSSIFRGMLTNLSKTYLGLTVIAMGNALPDALTTIALAKQGFAIMGMTGAFAGQLFGLLVGLGLALIKLNSSASKRDSLYGDNGDFPLFSQPGVNSIEILVIFTILTTLCITFAFGVTRKYVFDRLLAYILMGAYVAFFTIATIIAIYQAVHPPS